MLSCKTKSSVIIKSTQFLLFEKTPFIHADYLILVCRICRRTCYHSDWHYIYFDWPYNRFMSLFLIGGPSAQLNAGGH